MEKEFKKAIELGCTILSTSCSCGGNYAWFMPTGRGTYIVHGCICHNEPPTKEDIKKVHK